MAFICPKGHDSADADYCSECGLRINRDKSILNEVINIDKKETTDENTLCPDCSTPRNNENRFCEVCRYDFQTKVSYTTTINPMLTTVAPKIAAKLNVIIKTDPRHITDDEIKANCPKDMTEKIFPLDLDENLVGRRSVGKNIFPEIEVNDTGVSHRHLKFIKQQDGTYAVLELGSANGTKFNGNDLEAGVVTSIKAGDEFIIGMWTRLELRSRN